MNCFHFTYLGLKKLNYKIPSEWDNYTYLVEADKIEENPRHYLKNKILQRYFRSFTKSVDMAQENDIIMHDYGVGLAINNKRFMTLNHLGNVIVRTITKKYEIRRVN